jgi:hypothetical protein
VKNQFFAAALPAMVAAGFPPAVEPGFQPGGLGAGHGSDVEFAAVSGRLEAALYGNQDGCRYQPWWPPLRRATPQPSGGAKK